MSKKLTKMLSLVVAFAMVLTMALAVGNISANAATGSRTITISGANNATDTFKAYQVFAGTLSDGKLTNITWGDGVDGAALLKALKAEENSAYAKCEDAEDVAEVLATFSNDSAALKDFAAKADAAKIADKTSGTGSNTAITGVADGYYLIVSDSTDSQSAKTRFILEVAGADGKVEVKSDVPTSEKKVIDKNDSKNETSDWQDSADYDIGDEISYQIKAFLPDNVSDYSTYYLDFVDTMSAGLTYKEGSSIVYVAQLDNEGKIINKTQVSNSLEPTPVDYSGTEAAYTGGKVYTWTIDNVKGSPYNASNNYVIIIEYTATLNSNAVIGSAGNPNKMHIDFSNNPNSGGNGEKGNTPDDTNIVFTYKLIVNKTDESGNALPGATFKLQKKNSVGEYEDLETIVGTDKSTFEFKGLDDGDYRIVEVTPPEGYNSIDSIDFTITATHDITSEDPQLKSINVSDNSFKVEVIDGSTNASGVISTDIENKSGSTLPSTGGMGTTLLYIIGAILVLGAGVVLVTRRRMSR